MHIRPIPLILVILAFLLSIGPLVRPPKEITKFCAIAKELNMTEFPRVDGTRLKNGKLMEGKICQRWYQHLARALAGTGQSHAI